MKEIGKRIKRIRKRMGISQTELAGLAGRTSAAISQYESGTREPHSYTIPGLAKALNVTADYLLGNLTYSEADMLADPRARDIVNIFSDLPLKEQNIIYQFTLFLREANKK